MILNRNLQKSIVESLYHFPAVGILGSRQVGKTTLAKQIQKDIPSESIYLDLELPSDLNKLENSEIYLNQHQDKLVIIDEIQRLPNLFSVLRALIDQKRINGRFLLLGSASPALIKHGSETLAGRVRYFELAPFNLNETRNIKRGYQELWLKGGYPESFLAQSDKQSSVWRDAFIKTYLDRDLPQLNIQAPSVKLYRFLSMIAHFHGQLLNFQKIAGSLDVSAPTIRHYIDIFTESFIVRQLLPYFVNIKKRLIKSPKIYFRDTGILHTMLGICSSEDLYGNQSLGSSFEGFVIEQIYSIVPQLWEKFFYRTSAGAEIDLVLVKDTKKLIAIEIKHTETPRISKGFHIAFQDLQCELGFIIYPGKEYYKITQNVFALPVLEIERLIG